MCDLQPKTLDEWLQERIDKIKLVRHRAEEAGITAIRTPDDITIVGFADQKGGDEHSATDSQAIENQRVREECQTP